MLDLLPFQVGGEVVTHACCWHSSACARLQHFASRPGADPSLTQVDLKGVTGVKPDGRLAETRGVRPPHLQKPGPPDRLVETLRTVCTKPLAHAIRH